MLKKIISTDWDDTIALWGYKNSDTDSNPLIIHPDNFIFNSELIEQLAALQRGGCEIHVTTFRGRGIYFNAAGQSFGTDIEKHLPFIKEKWQLDIKEIHYTNGECKTKVLKKINAIRHYDDSSQVCCMVAANTETWPVFVDHGREKNSFLDQLVMMGKITKYPVKLG